MTNDDLDHPTVARRLSPRARTTLGAGDPVGLGDIDDEPTVAFVAMPDAGQRPDQQFTGSPQARQETLQETTALLRQLDPVPERIIVRAAAPLLLLISQLRNSIEQADVHALRQQVVAEIDRFEQLAQKSGVEAGDIIAARYVICSTIDETVLMTPWGSRSEWSSNSLLNQFHNETWGGEKVFSILDRIMADPAKKLPLLLLVQSCLMLGFEGRYRVLEGGRDKLEDLRLDLSRTIRRYSKVKPDQPLSKVTEGFKRGSSISSYPPVWLIGLVCLAILVIARGYSDFMLEGEIVPALSDIESLEVK
ncbi:type VI secretion system protein ImpK [Roseibium hamelinense]|uniref:Type VI secretion system protein ImpK n=1 Tax=Roseibium hamelinense TaxID=150831 RepID=A0A562SE46_9HYPH|nr:type IVB secretion system protein IcmH/DotU [Roseibium hamelinense]MTI42570.1 DotU family type IV/VI secretion system protein [Roseibium hamelinense]TWI79551.1 type VI secretion system protein ImpK [Roseibium hamelinense]